MVLKRKPRERQYDSLPEDVLRSAIDKFGIGQLKAARTLVVEGDRVVILNQKTETSRKYVIDTTAGRYFLKEVPWYCDDVAHRTFSRRIMNHLATELPVPKVLQTAAGGWEVLIDGSTFVLLEYRSGSPYDRSQGRMASSATTLAHMHEIGRRLPVDHFAPRENLTSIVTQHLDLASEVRPPRTKLGQAAFAALKDRAGAEMTQVPRESAPIPVHGDFIPWNLAFGSAEAVSAVHDFDNACVDSKLHDIGEALASFFLVPHAGMSAILHPITAPNIPIEELRRFLQHYQAVDLLSEADLVHLRLYTLGAWWESILLSYIRGDQPEDSLAIMTSYPDLLAVGWEQVIVTDSRLDCQ